MHADYSKKINEKMKKMNTQYHKGHSTHRGSRIEIRTPKIDMYESNNTYLVRLCIPGVSKDDIKVSFINDQQMEIKGTVKPTPQEGYNGTLLEEIFRGPFIRQIDFPSGIDKTNINFAYKGGILEIYIPKIT